MSSKVRIPSFLVKTFSELKTQEERDEFVQKFRIWLSNDITELFQEYVESKIEENRNAEEKNTSFLSRFDFNFKTAHSRGERTAYKTLLKQLGDK